MKKGVLTFDLTAAADGSSFPSMTPVDLALASAVDGSLRTDNRICYVHAGSAVARTAAMALTNTLLTLLESIVSCEGPSNALKLHPGMQKATLTFFRQAGQPGCGLHVAHTQCGYFHFSDFIVILMAPRKRFYVVWAGHATGVFDSWEECELQTKGYAGAKFKAFDSQGGGCGCLSRQS